MHAVLSFTPIICHAVFIHPLLEHSTESVWSVVCVHPTTLDISTLYWNFLSCSTGWAHRWCRHVPSSVSRLF